MRAKRGVLVGGLLLATVLGVAGGYFTGELTKAPYPTASGVPAPLGGVSATPSETPLPIKTPKVNPLPPLDPDELDFNWQRFDVTVGYEPPKRMSVRVPIGWTKKVLPSGDIRFTDPHGARWIRIKPVWPIKQSARQKRDQLVPSLETSIPYEQDFKVTGQSDDVIGGLDGDSRKVSILRYSYIPDEWLRLVTVQYVATGGSAGADAEMSITGLVQDEKALDIVAQKAAASVTLEN